MTARLSKQGAKDCVVLSLSGEPLGHVGEFVGDCFSLKTADRTLWLSSGAIYLEHPLYVELVCLRDGLSRYIVDPPYGILGYTRARHTNQ